MASPISGDTPSSPSSSSRCEAPTMNSIPLLRNILSRLPTVSLLRLRSVCRDWRHIIDHPHFAAMQHASAVESPRILLLTKPRGGAEPRIVVDDKFLVTSLPESTSWLHGVGSSCHGLLCFHDFYDRASYVLNPLTREVVLLPGVDPLRERWRPFSVGVGASSLTGRYKIVRLSYLRDGAVLAFRAEVLDQGSWSWRKVASAPPNLLLKEPVFAAGSIHWTDLGAGLAVGISSFDLAKEEFAPTPCPEGFRDPYLVELHGVLGLVDCLGEESVDVWVREEESGRWTKEYSVRLVPPLPMSSRYNLNVRRCGGGRKIALNYEDSFWFYDPATDELRHEQRHGASRPTVACSITVSLLSPAKLWNGGG